MTSFSGLLATFTPVLDRIRARFTLVAMCVLFGNVFSPVASGIDITISLDPRATYLLTNQDPNALDSPAIDLVALGLDPGEEIAIQALGNFCFTIFGQGCTNLDTATPMIGVFSSSSTLLASNQLNRVAGAIATGLPTSVTPLTLFGGLATDIPQDFFVSHAPSFTAVIIPANASFLFIAARDSFYGDNADPNGNFAVRIASIPEPATLLLLGVAMIGFLASRRRKLADSRD